MPLVEIVIVNYRTPRDLMTCVRSMVGVLDDTDLSLRVTIVNVSPTDEDRQVTALLYRSYWPGLLYLEEHDENIGYGRACNFAVREDSEADYLLFCNADIEFTPDALEQMVAAMEANPDWGVLGPRQVNQMGQLVHAGIFGTRAEPRHRAWKVADDPDRYGDVAPAVSVSGSIYMVRGRCWQELANCRVYWDWVNNSPRTDHCRFPETGPFLPTQLFYEETFFSYHAIEHGWKVIYYGPVRMIHTWHASIQTTQSRVWENLVTREARAMFREACDAVHGMPHD